MITPLDKAHRPAWSGGKLVFRSSLVFFVDFIRSLLRHLSVKECQARKDQLFKKRVNTRETAALRRLLVANWLHCDCIRLQKRSDAAKQRASRFCWLHGVSAGCLYADCAYGLCLLAVLTGCAYWLCW